MLFGKLECLTVYNRINYHKATLMFKCINNLAPEYLCSIFNSINENCPFLYSGTNLWNSLPSNINSLNNEICFKTKVKDYLLRFQIETA